MKQTIILLVIALALGAAACAQDTTALLEQLRSDKQEVQETAITALSRVGAPALEPLFDLLSVPEDAYTLATRSAVRAIVGYATRPGAGTERVAVANALLHQMRRDRPATVRRFALEWLSLVADGSNAPALVRLMTDPEVGEMARWVLIRLPGEAATQALCQAVATADTNGKLALLAALGERRSPLALPTIKPLLADPPLRAAAMQAIARIPSPDSESLLGSCLHTGTYEGDDLAPALAAYARLGDTLAAAGQRDLALHVYHKALTQAATEVAGCAALAGLGKVGGPAEVPLLCLVLDRRHASPLAARNQAGVARAALVSMPGAAATAAIAKAMAQADPQRKVTLLWVLGERRDPAALPALQAQVGKGTVAVQANTYLALGKIGHPQAAPMLMAGLRAGADQVREAAELALAAIPGDQVTGIILQQIPRASGDYKGALVRSLSYRQHSQVVPTLLAATKDEEAAVRTVALEALSKRLDAASFTDTFLAAARDREQDPAVAALEALLQLKAPAAEPLFLELSQSGRDAVQSTANRGYLVLAHERIKADPAAAAAMLRLGLSLATTNLNRSLALRGLAQLGDLEALPLVLPCLEDEGTRQSAAAALLPIATKLAAAGSKEQAIDLLRKVATTSSDQRVLREAGSSLRQLGVDWDPAANAGFITRWWVLGPLGGRNKWTKEDAFPVERPIDLSAAVTVGDRAYQWQPTVVDDPTGMLNFESVLGEHDDCAAYAYAEVTSPQAQDAIFSMGSDDSIICWLNGAKVHAFLGDRGYTPDQDRVAVKLQAGTNRVLIKVLDWGADWAGGLRITDPGSKPLVLAQRR